MKHTAYFVKNHYFHFSGTPPTNDKILNLNFLEFGTDILKTFYGYLHHTTLCFGAKIFSLGISLTFKVKVPCLKVNVSEICVIVPRQDIMVKRR